MTNHLLVFNVSWRGYYVMQPRIFYTLGRRRNTDTANFNIFPPYSLSVQEFSNCPEKAFESRVTSGRNTSVQNDTLSRLLGDSSERGDVFFVISVWYGDEFVFRIRPFFA